MIFFFHLNKIERKKALRLIAIFDANSFLTNFHIIVHVKGNYCGQVGKINARAISFSRPITIVNVVTRTKAFISTMSCISIR